MDAERTTTRGGEGGIRADGLELTLDGKKLVEPLSFSVAAGEKAALFGASGSGKTSVLRTLIGVHRPSRGLVFVGGLPVGPETIVSLRRKVAYVPQSLSFADDELVRDYVLLPFRFRANRDNRPSEDEIAAKMARFQLGVDLLDTRVRDVSGGERRRLALVRALLLEREILLLDEVSSGLDRANRRIVQEAIFGDNRTTVLAVTHDEEWMAASSPCIEIRAPGEA